MAPPADMSLLVAGFEDGTLPPSGFHHREHLMVTWFYLTRDGAQETIRRMTAGLQRIAARAGQPRRFDETLTRRWVLALDEARQAHPDAATFDALVAARPDLLDRSSVHAQR